MNLTKLELVSKEGIKHELKMKRIDEEFLIDYIVKINETYNKLIDKVNEQDQIIREARELLNDNSERCKSALTNPEHTIVSKHELLKLEINDIKGVMEILDRNVK